MDVNVNVNVNMNVNVNLHMSMSMNIGVIGWQSGDHRDWDQEPDTSEIKRKLHQRSYQGRTDERTNTDGYRQIWRLG